MTANTNGSAPSMTVDWQAEAEFWQQKYFEQLMHSTQIITALSRPMLASVAQKIAAQNVKEAVDAK